MPQTILDMFVGSWKLSGLIGEGPLVERLGTDPVGILVYDSAGNMSVQIMNRERGTVSLVSFEDFKEALHSYVGYFGSYTVNLDEKTVTHHVVGSLSPTDVGREFKRSYEFADDRLILTANGILAGEHIAAQLVWHRLSKLA